MRQAKTYMMLIFIVLSRILFSCKSKTVIDNNIDGNYYQEKIGQKNKEVLEQVKEFKDFVIFNLTDTLKADFNYDGKLDKAIFIQNNLSSGIVISEGRNTKNYKIGFGESFGHFEDFNWVDYWGILNDSETFEVIIEEDELKEGREIQLLGPSIFLRKYESGGGLITFKNGEYIWIHQTD